MVTRRLIAALFMAAILLVGVSAFAQVTGQIVGTVTSAGAPLPGATITIASPALQGVRTTVTGANGLIAVTSDGFGIGNLTPRRSSQAWR